MEATTIKLPQPVADDLAALERRSATLAKRSRTLTMVAVSAAASAAAAYALSDWLAPSVTLAAVHMPDEILQLFAAHSQSGGLGLATQTLNGSMADVLSGWGPKVIWVIGVVAGGIGAILTGNMKLAIGPLLLVGPVFILPTLLDISGPSDDAGESDRAAVVRLASAADHAGLERMLSKVDASGPLRIYVLAQARLAAGAVPKPPDAAGAELAAHVKQLGESIRQGLPALLSGESLYALESAVLGQPVSAPALAYFEESSRNSGFATTAGRVFTALAALTILLGSGTAVLGVVLRARLARIRPLLGTGSARQDSASVRPRAPMAPHLEHSHVGLDGMPPGDRPERGQNGASSLEGDKAVDSPPCSMARSTVESSASDQRSLVATDVEERSDAPAPADADRSLSPNN